MKGVKVARYDSGKLKILEIARGYKNKLEENVRGLPFESHDSIKDKWDKISQGINKIASEVLGN
jgi:hypothetical protein